MDWDKLRIFHAVGEAGSFTHAGEVLHLSQSAISRQIQALEDGLGASLFHRHARGLKLTEQGELLFRATQEIAARLAVVESSLRDTKDKPSGQLRVTATVGFGSTWLTPRIREFHSLYPDIRVELILDDRELDLTLREADVALRLREPVQPSLIMRRLFTVHTHLYAAPSYLQERGAPQVAQELDRHALIVFGGSIPMTPIESGWVLYEGATSDRPRQPVFKVNSIYGVLQAIETGLGIGALPDYLAHGNSRLVQVLPDNAGPSFETYFTYAQEMRNSQRIVVFRDFLLQKVREWVF
jgi:DNA-binding transcriptional LysR family regulator